MKKAPEGPPHNTKCPQSEAKKPLNRENTCPRRGSNRRQPLKIRHSPENLPNPAQSGTRTTESGAQGMHIVHTRFCELLMLCPATVPPSFAPESSTTRHPSLRVALPKRRGQSEGTV
jgi:hypothetical protein